MNNHFKEQDWKLFRSRIADWQEAYMDRLNREYIALLSDPDKNPADKFWELEERLHQDKRSAGVQVRRAEIQCTTISLTFCRRESSRLTAWMDSAKICWTRCIS